MDDIFFEENQENTPTTEYSYENYSLVFESEED